MAALSHDKMVATLTMYLPDHDVKGCVSKQASGGWSSLFQKKFHAFCCWAHELFGAKPSRRFGSKRDDVKVVGLHPMNCGAPETTLNRYDVGAAADQDLWNMHTVCQLDLHVKAWMIYPKPHLKHVFTWKLKRSSQEIKTQSSQRTRHASLNPLPSRDCVHPLQQAGPFVPPPLVHRSFLGQPRPSPFHLC